MADVLDWLSGEGFERIMAELGIDYATAVEYRQRFLIKAMRGMIR